MNTAKRTSTISPRRLTRLPEEPTRSAYLWCLICEPRALHADASDGDFLWCVLCERTFARGQFRQVGNDQLSPYEGCEGGLLFEPWEWSHVRKANPNHPRVPYRDVSYPFFGREPPRQHPS